MIGKPLSERYRVAERIELRPLDGERAVAILRERLGIDAASIVQVRARDAKMVACVFVEGDAAAVSLCRELGLELAPRGSGVVGLLGSDAARLFAELAPERRAWLEAPSGARETKVLLIAGGIAMLSVETKDGKVAITHVAP